MHVHTKRKPLRDAWCLVVLDVSGRQGGWRSWHVPLIYFLLLSQEWEKKYLWTLCYSKVRAVCLTPTYNPLLSLDQEWVSMSRLTQLADCDFVCLARRWVRVISSSERLLTFCSGLLLLLKSTIHDSPRGQRHKLSESVFLLSKRASLLSFSISLSLHSMQLILQVMARVLLTAEDSEPSSLT